MPGPQLVIITLILVGGVVLGVMILFPFTDSQIGRWLTRHWSPSIQRQIAKSLNATKDGERLRVFRKNRELYYQFHGSKYGGGSTLEVSIPSKHPHSIRFRRETSLDVKAKAVGCANEVQLLDPSFDSAIYIESDDETNVKFLLSYSGAKAALKQMLECGFSEVTVVDDEITARWHEYSMGEESLRHVTLALDQLAILNEAFLSVAPMNNPQKTKSQKLFRSLCLTTSGILVAVAISSLNLLGIRAPLDFLDFCIWSLQYTIPAYLFALYISYLRLRGTSQFIDRFSAAVVLGLFIFLCGGIGFLAHLNYSLDTGTESTHYAVVKSKWSSRRTADSPRTYTLYLRSWREGRYTEQLPVSRVEYLGVEPRESKVELVTSSGYFGFEWISSYSLGRDDTQKPIEQKRQS